MRPPLQRLAIALALLCPAMAWPQEPSAAEPAPAAVSPPAPPVPAPSTPTEVLPTLAALEAAGATIGEIRVVSRDIFDLTDPKEDHLLFRWANALHIQTRPSVIRRALLFGSGDKVSLRAFEETERLLRANPYLYDVQFRPVAYRDGVVDIEVSTRDTWSLDFGIRASRAGGANTSGIQLRDQNLFGTGTTLSFGRTHDVDRSSNEFEFSNPRAFGTWASVSYSHATNSDGRSDAVSVVRPFYALDSRWAAGVTASKYTRLDPVYNAGELTSEYRHRQSKAEVFGGWSAGLIDGWVQRYSLGLNLQDDAYAVEPGVTAPAALPTDRRLVGPFLRYQLIEERFQRETNRNLMGRPEFFALGLASTVKLGWAAASMGSSRDTLLYAASVSRGFEPAPDQTLIASAALTGQYVDGRVQQQILGASTQYYLPQGRRWLFYASAEAGLLTRPDANQSLLLGGDDGLRGYPLRYQSGTRRALVTLEERFYTDIYLWRLFRIGGAAFYDVGRAWGGDNVNTKNPGWLQDVGFGLRIVVARTAFGNVIHIDVAFPLNATPDIQKVQFLVKTKATF